MSNKNYLIYNLLNFNSYEKLIVTTYLCITYVDFLQQ